MSRREPPTCAASLTWLRGRLKREGEPHALAALTGQDARALAAFAHLLELYATADRRGRRHALVAMVFARAAMQSSCQVFAKKMIPALLDWPDEARLWRELDGIETRIGSDFTRGDEVAS